MAAKVVKELKTKHSHEPAPSTTNGKLLLPHNGLRLRRPRATLTTSNDHVIVSQERGSDYLKGIPRSWPCGCAGLFDGRDALPANHREEFLDHIVKV